MTVKQGLKLSAIVSKLNIKITNAEASETEIGKDLMMQIVTNAHLAEKEIISFVASTKKIKEEEAEEVDLIEFIKEFFKDSGALNFFKSAVK